MSNLTRDQAMWGAIALSMLEQPRSLHGIGPGAPRWGCKPRIQAEQPQGPTPKRAKVKAARKQRRKTK